MSFVFVAPKTAVTTSDKERKLERRPANKPDLREYLGSMRIAGITIPREKQIETALTYIYGIGRPSARSIVNAARVNPLTRVKNLSDSEEDAIRALVEKGYKTEGDLRREVGTAIKRLRDIKCYRGARHAKHLPVRGQRTKTNSRTVRGNKRNIAPSGKKQAAQKT